MSLQEGAAMSRPGTVSTVRCVMLALPLLCAVAVAAEEPAVSLKERRLLAIPENHALPITGNGTPAHDYSVTVSRNGAQAAYIASKDGHNFVVVGDRKGPDFDGEISSLFLSHDGSVVHYHVADKAGTRTLQVNHKPLGDATMQVKIAVGAGVQFSPDGSRYAAIMKEGEQEFVLVNGVKGPKFNVILHHGFALEGTTVAYLGRGSGKDRIMLGDQPIAEAPFIREFMLSRDGKHYAYDGGGSIVVDGVAGPRIESIKLETFSPDGTRVAYWGKVGDKRFAVVGNERGPDVERAELLGANAIDFSPDSRHHAFAAKVGDKQHVFVDWQPGEAYDEVADFRFTPDSKAFIYRATLNQKVFLVANNQRGPEFDSISSRYLKISPDGTKIAYWAMRDGKTHMVVNADPGPAWDGSVSYSAVFSPDSATFAYTVHASPAGLRRGFIVVNHQKGPEFDSVGYAVFSPDSRHMAHSATRGGKQFVVIDGRIGPECDSARDLAFSPDSGRLAYTAFLGREVWRKVIDVPR